MEGGAGFVFAADGTGVVAVVAMAAPEGRTDIDLGVVGVTALPPDTAAMGDLGAVVVVVVAAALSVPRKVTSSRSLRGS